MDTGAGCRTGSGSEFTVGYSDVGEEMMYAGTRLLNHTPYSPYSYWSLPFSPQMSEETHKIADDPMGTLGDHNLFSELVLQRFNDTWATTSDPFPPPQLACPSATRYHVNAFSGHQFAAWRNGTTYVPISC